MVVAASKAPPRMVRPRNSRRLLPPRPEERSFLEEYSPRFIFCFQMVAVLDALPFIIFLRASSIRCRSSTREKRLVASFLTNYSLGNREFVAISQRFADGKRVR